MQNILCALVFRADLYRQLSPLAQLQGCASIDCADAILKPQIVLHVLLEKSLDK